MPRLGTRTLALVAIASLMFLTIRLASTPSPTPERRSPPPTMSSSGFSSYTVTHPPPPPDVIRRYDAFIALHTLRLHFITTSDSATPGICYSLVFFSPTTQEPHRPGTWGVLISYTSLADSAKYAIRHYFHRNPPQPLAPSARFAYAFSPRLRFGNFISPRGTVLVPSAMGPDGNSTLVGAVYRSSDPRHGGAETTIGGAVLAVNEREQKKLYGLTLGMIWDGQPKEEGAQRGNGIGPLRTAPTVERGEGEVMLAPLGEEEEEGRGVMDDSPLPAAGYRELGPATADDDEMEQGINLNSIFGSLRGMPWVAVDTAKEEIMPKMNRLSSGEEIGLGQTEPEVGSELYVATAAGWGALPSCVLEEDVKAHIFAPYTIGPRKARRLRLKKGSTLSPRDVGAWILEKTDTGLRVCYQIVALEEPDEVYAIFLMDVLREFRPAMFGVTTLPGTMDNVPYLEAWDWLYPRNTETVVGVAVETVRW